MHLAIRNGHEDIAKLLCDKDIDISIKSKQGRTALLVAGANFKGRNLVNYFLNKGLKFDSEIHEAAVRGDLEKIKHSITKLKIAVNLSDGLGNTSLLYAAENDHINVVQWLLKKRSVKFDEKDNNGTTAFLRASWRDHINVEQ